MGAGCPWGSRVSCAGRERGKGSARAPLEASGEVCSGRSSRCAAPRSLREARSPPGAAAGGSGAAGRAPVPLRPARGRSQQGSSFSGLLTSFHPPLGCSWLGPAGSSSPAPLEATTTPGGGKMSPKGAPGGKTSPKGALGSAKGHGVCLPEGICPCCSPCPTAPQSPGDGMSWARSAPRELLQT